MALRNQEIENNLAYKINAKRAKRTSHKRWKQEANRKHRRLMNSNIEFVPEYRKRKDYEF